MIVDIFNEVFTNVKQAVNPVIIFGTYPSTKPTFPCIIMEEMSNVSVEGSIDSSGEKHNEVTFEINIFTDSQDKVSKAKEIRNLVDSVMSEKYSMNRIYAGTIPNFLDNNIYRYTLRYTCIVDSNKVIYRR